MHLGTSMGTLTRALLAGGLLLLVTLVTYLPALDGKFIWDDEAHVTTQLPRSPSGFWRIWTDPRATQQPRPPVPHKHGLLAEAVAGCRAAITLRPDFAAAYNNLGSAYRAQGKYPDAITAWQRAVGLDPNSAAERAAQVNIEIVRTQRVR